MENININKIYKDDSDGGSGNGNRRQLIYTTTLCFFGSVLCIAAFYYLYSWSLEGHNFIYYFPIPLFGVILGTIFLGFCLIMVVYGFLSGVYDLLG